MITDVIGSAKRKADETFEQYKNRRKLENKILSNYISGRIVHNSITVHQRNVLDKKSGKMIPETYSVPHTYMKEK